MYDEQLDLFTIHTKQENKNMIVYGTEAKEIYSNAVDRNSIPPVNGVFEYYDMGGAMYRSFKSICNELFVKDFGTMREAIEFLNS